MSKQIKCPKCDGAEFKCQQYTWNEQDLHVLTDGTLDWGMSDNYDYETEKPAAVVCAECDHDCSDLFEDQIEMFEDRFIVRGSKRNGQHKQ